MSIIDDFLMTELAGSDEYGEAFVEYFLHTVLGQKIEIKDIKVQKVETPGDIDKRAIRFDIRTKVSLSKTFLVTEMMDDSIKLKRKAIINIEMQAKSDKSARGKKYDIRKRSRLYQAMVDTNMLIPGSGYNELDDVLIIICSSFDIFGLDMIKYTFTNICLENNELLLDDGAYRIYLNTSDKIGGTDELNALLKYIANSTEENAVNSRLNDIHTIVTKVKQSRKAREKYMCIWETEERLRDEVREEMQEKLDEKEAELAEKDTELIKSKAIIAALEARLAAVNG